MSKWTWFWLAMNALLGVFAAIDWQAGDLPTSWFGFVIFALIAMSLRDINVGLEASIKTKVEY